MNILIDLGATELLSLIPYKYPKKESQITHNTGEEENCLNTEKKKQYTDNLEEKGAAKVHNYRMNSAFNYCYAQDQINSLEVNCLFKHHHIHAASVLKSSSTVFTCLKRETI